MLAEMRGSEIQAAARPDLGSAIPAARNSILRPYAYLNVVAPPQLWLFLIDPADTRLRIEAT
jgi:hypothetical protein